jgi:hypothetical protein
MLNFITITGFVILDFISEDYLIIIIMTSLYMQVICCVDIHKDTILVSYLTTLPIGLHGCYRENFTPILLLSLLLLLLLLLSSSSLSFETFVPVLLHTSIKYLLYVSLIYFKYLNCFQKIL